MSILCSRAKCGCLASALLADINKKGIKEFTKAEEKQGRIVAWEDRKYVWAERCEDHEKVFGATLSPKDLAQYEVNIAANKAAEK